MPRGIPKKAKGKVAAAIPPVISPPIPPPTFHPFPRLPLEIQQEILSLLKPGARTVKIWTDPDRSDRTSSREEKDRQGLGPGTTPTPLLHVSREIRAFALKWYTLLHLRPKRRANAGALFIDYARDTLHVYSLQRLYGVRTSVGTEERLVHMKHVEAQVRFLIVDNAFNSSAIGLVARFRNLDTLSANYDLTPFNEKQLVKRWTKRAKEGGWEVKIPRFSVTGGVLRDLVA